MTKSVRQKGGGEQCREKQILRATYRREKQRKKEEQNEGRIGITLDLPEGRYKWERSVQGRTKKGSDSH